MKEQKFERVMRAIDDQWLEEAQKPKKKAGYTWCGIAACLCLLSGLLLWKSLPQDAEELPEEPTLQEQGVLPQESAEPLQEPQQAAPEEQEVPDEVPVREEEVPVTLESLNAMGYPMRVPEGAETLSCNLLEEGAQAVFAMNGAEYTYTALRAEEPQTMAEGTVTWYADSLKLRLEQSEEASSVSWYVPEEQIRWSLSSDGGTEEILTTAREILLFTGLDVAAAPEGAEDIRYNVYELDGLVAAETKFTVDGTEYSYRMAATGVIEEEFADISGLDGEYAAETEDSVQWCPARLYYNSGGQGKIVWFDLVPGLLYSLSMEEGASEEALLTMAETLFAPAQETDY